MLGDICLYCTVCVGHVMEFSSGHDFSYIMNTGIVGRLLQYISV